METVHAQPVTEVPAPSSDKEITKRTAGSGRSRVATYFAIEHCLWLAEGALELDTAWKPQNDHQAWFLRNRAALAGPFPGLKSLGIVTQDIVKGQKFFADNGMKELGDKIKPLSADDYLCAVMGAINSRWNVEGEMGVAELSDERTSTPKRVLVARMPEATIFNNATYTQWVAAIKAGDLTYFFAKADDAMPHLEGRALYMAVQDLVREAVTRRQTMEDELLIPFVDARLPLPMSWLEGLRTTVKDTGRGCVIKQADGLVDFVLTHVGAHLKVGAFAVANLERMGGKKLSGPFVIGVADAREGQDHRLAAAFLIDPEDWIIATPENKDKYRRLAEEMRGSQLPGGSPESIPPALDARANEVVVPNDAGELIETLRPKQPARELEALPAGFTDFPIPSGSGFGPPPVSNWKNPGFAPGPPLPNIGGFGPPPSAPSAFEPADDAVEPTLEDMPKRK